MTNIRLVDVVFEGEGYMLDAASKASGTKVARATRKLDCNPRAHGEGGHGVIKSGDCFIYQRGEGRMCCRCAIGLGALEKVDTADVER